MPLLLVQPRTNVIKNTDLEGGFYNSLRVPFLIIRFTGLFPLSGLMQRTSQGSGLNWKLWYFIIYLVSVCLQIFQLVLIITDFMFVGCYADNMTEFFMASTILFFIIPTFHKIAKNWESDIKAIEEIEMSLPRVVDHRKPLIIVLIINLLLALVYHIFYWVFTLVHHNRCHTKMTLDYFLRMVSDYGPMYHILGIALLLKRLQNNFILSSLDAVIILISLHLNIRIKGFNNFLKQKVNQAHKETPNWPELQICFTRITRFVRIVNDNINPLVLVSFSINLLYLSQQTYIILNNLTRTNLSQNPDCLEVPRSDNITTIFICFSFMFVTTKVVAVSLIAAEIHTLSREPLNALYELPASAYNHEFQRLMTQVYRSKVCLTGLNLFHITRGTLLTIVANLMTYELVLLQI